MAMAIHRGSVAARPALAPPRAAGCRPGRAARLHTIHTLRAVARVTLMIGLVSLILSGAPLGAALLPIVAGEAAASAAVLGAMVAGFGVAAVAAGILLGTHEDA